jgi:hypothetical protein
VFPVFQKAAINFSIVFVAVLFAIGSQWWTLNHLPYHDCLPYRVGSNLSEKMKPAPNATPAEYASVLTYEKNGVKKDFPADKIPWQDKSWTYVSTKTTLIKAATGEPEIHDFVLTDSTGADSTSAILNAKGYTFLWFLRDPAKANLKNMETLHNIINKCKENHVPFYVLASVGWDICQTYKDVWDMNDVKFLLLDGTVNKTAMRTNPGLMLMHDGVVEGKWSFWDYPKDITFSNGNVIINANK